MFCPNCGRDCANKGVCASCGYRVSKVGAQNIGQVRTEVQKEHHDLMYYFEQYQPNRTAAIKALRKDTNMSLVEAKKTIDRLFDEQTNQTGINLSLAFQNLKSAIKASERERCNTEMMTTHVQQCNEAIATEESCKEPLNTQGNNAMELPDETQSDSVSDQKLHPYTDYSHYYLTYRPDRVKAIMALRVDTGMGAVQAKQVIDALFDSKENGLERRRESESVDDLKSRLVAAGKVYCPKCFSTKLFVHKESTTRAILYYRTAVFRLIGSIINLCYTLWGKRTEYVCLECGHTWKKE